MRVLCDFHHSSLLRSLVLLFEKRLGYDVYRPIGMKWYKEGFWAINNLEDTAKQFLQIGSQPLDKTPGLNNRVGAIASPLDVFKVYDPGMASSHWACTLDFFKRTPFDYVIASIPQHVVIFRELIAKYNPKAKLIVQMGNNWALDHLQGHNVLASIAPQDSSVNAVFYHQEFDLDIFKPTPNCRSLRISSYVNVIREMPPAWQAYNAFKNRLEPLGWTVNSFGGQCPDGNKTGPRELAESMIADDFVLHVKPKGDGYGHILHNAYAIGRPVITYASDYKDQLGEYLLKDGTFINLDEFSSIDDAIAHAAGMSDEALKYMSEMARARFYEVVNFKQEAKMIEKWLKTL